MYGGIEIYQNYSEFSKVLRGAWPSLLEGEKTGLLINWGGYMIFGA